MITELTREELKAKIDRGEGLVVVETLGPGYYEDAHLPGAINIPHTEVEDLAPAMLPDKSAEIVVYLDLATNSATHSGSQRALPSFW